MPVVDQNYNKSSSSMRTTAMGNSITGITNYFTHQRTVEYELSNGVPHLTRCSVNICPNCNCQYSETFDKIKNNQNLKMDNSTRDRIGFLGCGDSEMPGTISGLERLKNKRYNKVGYFFKNYKFNIYILNYNF